MPRGITMGESGKAGIGRILWIDAVRGVVICLVVLTHALTALRVWQPQAFDTGFLNAVQVLSAICKQVRMPAFFLCAGLIFAFVMHRGWRWFFLDRCAQMVWLVVLWTGIAATVEGLGLHLFPGHAYPFVPVDELFWVPYGNLWFIYALVSASAVTLLLRPLPLGMRLILVLGLCHLFSEISHLVADRKGLVLLFNGLASSALPFFTLGAWYGPLLFRLLRRRVLALACAAGLPAVAIYALALVGPLGIWFTVLVSMPLTLAFVAMIRLLSDWQGLARPLARIGRRSMHIFLAHQVFLAGFYLALRRFAPGTDPALGLLLLWVGPIVGSLLLACAVQPWPNCLLFQKPVWLVWPSATADHSAPGRERGGGSTTVPG